MNFKLTMEILFLILGGPRKFSKCKFLEVEYKYKLITSWEIHFWEKLLPLYWIPPETVVEQNKAYVVWGGPLFWESDIQ